MTDVAVSDGGATAPADTAPVTIVEANQVDIPTPLSTQPPEQTPEQPKPEQKKAEVAKTASDAVKRAQEAVKAKLAEKEATDAKAKAEPKQEAKQPEPVKSAAERDESGKFVSRQQPETQQPAQPVQPANPNAPHREPPARFSPDAKAAWATAPEPVQAEVHRAIKELEAGHQKYKASHDSWETVRQFDEVARRNGGNLRASLERVVDMENSFLRNPIEGFQKVADHFGLSLRAVAAHIMGQTPDQVQQRHDSTISQMRQESSHLRQQIDTLNATVQQMREAAVIQQIEAMKANMPRFDELGETISQLLTTKMATTLPEAYEMAERLKPAPSNGFNSPAQPLIPAATPQPRPVNPAGQKQITGAPANGSNPSPQRKPPSLSVSETVKRAIARSR